MMNVVRNQFSFSRGASTTGGAAKNQFLIRNRMFVLLFFLVRPCLAVDHYVAANNANPLPPYTNWDSAAADIQSAIDVSTDGDVVWVTNGVYATGGKSVDGVLTNRITLDKALTVRSVAGPSLTFIQGGTPTNGPGAVRCAWLTNGALLSGFTLQGGATRAPGGGQTGNGGGAWCASAAATLANCIIRSNVAYQTGGGLYQGTLQTLGWSATTA